MHIYERGIDPAIPEHEQSGQLWREGEDCIPVQITITPPTVSAAREKLASMTAGMAHKQSYTIVGALALESSTSPQK